MPIESGLLFFDEGPIAHLHYPQLVDSTDANFVEIVWIELDVVETFLFDVPETDGFLSGKIMNFNGLLSWRSSQTDNKVSISREFEFGDKASVPCFHIEYHHSRVDVPHVDYGGSCSHFTRAHQGFIWMHSCACDPANVEVIIRLFFQ